MHTPNLHRTTVRAGVLAVTALLIVFALLVYVLLAVSLDRSLGAVLDTRAAVALEEAADLTPEQLVDELAAVGIPATVRTPDGRWVQGDRTSDGAGDWPDLDLRAPLAVRSVERGDGTRIDVFASRASDADTLRWLSVSLVAGVVLGTAGAYWLLRRLVDGTLAPLSSIAETAEDISAGGTARRLVPDQPDTPLGRVAVSFDRMLDSLNASVTAEAEERLRTQRFLADAAHQLRTPLAGVRASVELLLREDDPALRDDLLAGAIRGTVRATNVITGLLHVVRLDRGQRPARAPTDLRQLLADEVARAADVSPRLAVVHDVGSGGPVVAAVDAHEIVAAIGHLLDNARRHATERITVSLETNRDRISIRIADDGAGVPAGAEELVFEPFATLDGRGGSGLGLPIARGVAEAHGGSVRYVDGAFVMTIDPAPTAL